MFYGKAYPRAKIERGSLPRLPVAKMFYSEHMRGSQIGNVDIIPHTCAVRCGVVVPHDPKFFQLAGYRHEHPRNKVGFRGVAFAAFPFRISACRIEITKRHPRKPGRPCEIRQHPFYKQFCFPIRSNRVRGHVFGYGAMVRDAVDRRCAGNYDIAYSRIPHGFQNMQRSSNIIPDICSRIAEGFPHL